MLTVDLWNLILMNNFPAQRRWGHFRGRSRRNDWRSCKSVDDMRCGWNVFHLYGHKYHDSGMLSWVVNAIPQEASATLLSIALPTLIARCPFSFLWCVIFCSRKDKYSFKRISMPVWPLHQWKILYDSAIFLLLFPFSDGEPLSRKLVFAFFAFS